MARVDIDRIRMVLDNIVDNAGKYTPSGKYIQVQVGHDGGIATIAVKDQGVGMARDEVNRIFDKFARLENPLSDSVEGSGLGLYWAKKIIDLHNGSISVRSKPGKGTTFTIKLPVR
jgi:signal transduction histidine kinase